jgi:hypothetical protein
MTSLRQVAGFEIDPDEATSGDRLVHFGELDVLFDLGLEVEVHHLQQARLGWPLAG